MTTIAAGQPEDSVDPGLGTDNERGSAFDAVLMLASALQAVPSSHAVILGAGVSVAAGVPSAWGVQEALVRRIATARGEEISGEPHEWYQRVYSREATYEGLLGELAPTQHERQAILRSFFEPDLHDEEARPHEPSEAHVALARLARSGHLRVFVTLNFDHLMERALREEGVEPTVVRSVDDLVGLAPLHTIRCLVVHLHGDYLTATTMRNTTAELAEYESQVVDFLQRLLHDHALLIVGWSAVYDPALQVEISRSLLERYTSYWIDPGDLRTTATDLAARHRIVHIQSTADDVLGRLADAVAALDDRHARHPHSITDAVGTAKRDLSGQSVAVRVHDRLHVAMTDLWQHPDLNLVDFQQDQEPYNNVVSRLVEATMVPAALVAATSYWGDERSDAWFLPEVIRFSTRSRGGGIVRLLALPELCGTMLFHAAGVAAVAAGRLTAARALLTAGAVPLHGRHLTLRERLHAARGFAESPAPSAAVMRHLKPIFAEQLALGPHAYEEAWEMFDVLDLLEGVAGHPSFTERAAAYASAETKKINADELMNEAERGSDADAHDTAQGAQFNAHQSEKQALGDIADLVWAQGHHVRLTREDFTHRKAARAEALLHDLERSGAMHPLVTAGFGGGDWTALRLALKAVSVAVDRVASNHVQRLALQGGADPQDYFWLDTGEAPRY